MVNARSARLVLAACALAALTMTGVQAASIPSSPVPTADTSVQTVHKYCYKGWYYVHNGCKRYGYDSYGNYVCLRWYHRKAYRCGGYGGSGGSY
jgi:hypothetical protein